MIAVARKLLTILNAIVRDGIPWKGALGARSRSLPLGAAARSPFKRCGATETGAERMAAHPLGEQ